MKFTTVLFLAPVGPENVIQGDGAFGGGEKPSAAAAQILRRHSVGKAVFESPTTTRIDRGPPVERAPTRPVFLRRRERIGDGVRGHVEEKRRDRSLGTLPHVCQARCSPTTCAVGQCDSRRSNHGEPVADDQRSG